MDAAKQREIARTGGKAAHQTGTAHEFTADEARAAGRKGGERVSQDRSHMAAIGRMGGRRSAGRRGSKATPDAPLAPNAEASNPGQDNPGTERIEAEEVNPT